MSSKNAIFTHLDLLKAAEREAADLYSYISQATADNNPVLSELFSELAQEETVHMKYFDMLEDLQAQSEDPFLETDESMLLIASELEAIRKKSAAIRSRGQVPAEREIIETALEVENGVMERHGVYAMRINDESLRKLFQSLQFADASHVQRLQDYLAARK